MERKAGLEGDSMGEAQIACKRGKQLCARSRGDGHKSLEDELVLHCSGGCDSLTDSCSITESQL